MTIFYECGKITLKSSQQYLSKLYDTRRPSWSTFTNSENILCKTGINVIHTTLNRFYLCENQQNV